MTLTTLHVRFAETDQMAVAHHSAYVLWCEVARVDWLSQHGMSYKQFEVETGLSLAVSSLKLEYRQGVGFDDEVSIATRLVEARSRRFSFVYQLRHKEQLIARAQTTHTPTNRQGQAVRMPQAYLEALAKHLEAPV